MSKRNAILIAAGAMFIAAFLFVPSFTARAFAAALLLLVALIVLAKTLQTSSKDSLSQEDEEAGENASEIFALGKLFEATMSGMREGLLVVDKDMRVVASNPAAHRLFNLSGGKLNSQRLTELTRNPAMYSAFLDALMDVGERLAAVDVGLARAEQAEVRARDAENSNHNSAASFGTAVRIM